MYFQGATVQFVANRDCEINGHLVNEDDFIIVKIRKNWDKNDGKKQNGSWGWGEYTSEKILDIAEEILTNDDIIIFRRKVD